MLPRDSVVACSNHQNHKDLQFSGYSIRHITLWRIEERHLFVKFRIQPSWWISEQLIAMVGGDFNDTQLTKAVAFSNQLFLASTSNLGISESPE